MVKITPALLASWEKLVPRLGERDAADALDASQGGMRAAARRRDHAPARKDRRGRERLLKPALRKRIHAFTHSKRSKIGIRQPDGKVREAKVAHP